MNNKARCDLFNKLNEDQVFANLTKHKERIDYVLNNVHKYDQFRDEIKANMDRAKVKSAKSISIAVQYNEEAQLFRKMASIKKADYSDSKLREALDALAKVGFLINVV